MLLRDLMHEMTRGSMKAAELARVIRSEQALFRLLVEEKTGDAKNKKFVQDFKTLADVLIQEMIKHDLGLKFPGIVANIQGEESNKFTNVLGETVVLEVQETIQQTSQLLAKVLDNNQEAAALMAQVVHSHLNLAMDQKLEALKTDIAVKDVGIWIDPIDATAQYIKGYESELEGDGVYRRGLPSVAVLIGAFDKNTGQPFAGVANQPFTEQDSGSNVWKGCYTWGISHDGTNITSFSTRAAGTPTSLVLSSSEDPTLTKKLKAKHKILLASGAGYKCLCVVDNLVGAYLSSGDGTYKYDTCSPHAILLAMGGGMVDYGRALDVVRQNRSQSLDDLAELVSGCQTEYHTGWANSLGVLAYADIKFAVNLLKSVACTDKKCLLI